MCKEKKPTFHDTTTGFFREMTPEEQAEKFHSDARHVNWAPA